MTGFEDHDDDDHNDCNRKGIQLKESGGVKGTVMKIMFNDHFRNLVKTIIKKKILAKRKNEMKRRRSETGNFKTFLQQHKRQ